MRGNTVSNVIVLFIQTDMIDESQTISDIISTLDQLLVNGLSDIGALQADEISGSGEELVCKTLLFFTRIFACVSLVKEIDFHIDEFKNLL